MVISDMLSAAQLPQQVWVTHRIARRIQKNLHQNGLKGSLSSMYVSNAKRIPLALWEHDWGKRKKIRIEKNQNRGKHDSGVKGNPKVNDTNRNTSMPNYLC